MNNPFKNMHRPSPSTNSNYQAWKTQQRNTDRMAGRNGADELARFAFILAMIFLVLSLIFSGNSTAMTILLVLAIVLMVYGWWRALSKNTAKRYLENTLFQGILRKVKKPFAKPAAAASANAAKVQKQAREVKMDREAQKKYGKDFKLFKCPSVATVSACPKAKAPCVLPVPTARPNSRRAPEAPHLRRCAAPHVG